MELVVPESSLSLEEISSIVDHEDYFFYKNSKSPLRQWERMDRKYSRHHLLQRTDYFSLEQVLRKTIADGFPLRFSMEELLRAGLNRRIALGSLVPSINLSVGEGVSPINFNNAFVNLFGFLMPQHWLNLAAQNKQEKAQRYLFLKTALDEILNAQRQYIKVHKAIIDFEIINFYFIHYQLLMRHYDTSGYKFNTVKAYLGTIGIDMATKRGESKLLFDQLARTMALESVTGPYQEDYGLGKLNIRPLENFPTKVDFELLAEAYRDKDQFTRLAVSRSLELQALKEFYQISKLGIGITASGQTFSNHDAKALPPSGHHGQFGLSFGFETLPTILYSVSAARTAKIDVQEQYLDILNLARTSHDLFTNMIGAYTEAKRSYDLNKVAFFSNIEALMLNGYEPDLYFITAFENTLNAELKLNRAYHNVLEARYLIQRLAVTDESNMLPKILRMIPKRKKTSDLAKNYLPEEFQLRQAKLGYLDQVAVTLTKVEDLSSFLQGEIIDREGRFMNVCEEDINEAILNNLDALLSNPRSLRHGLIRRQKDQEFFIQLSLYLKNKDLKIEHHRARKLSKRCGFIFEGESFMHELKFKLHDVQTQQNLPESTNIQDLHKVPLKINGQSYSKALKIAKQSR